MSRPKLRLVQLDDWSALYVDGRAIHQGHSISLSQFFDLLKANSISTCLDFQRVDAGVQDAAKAYCYGDLPKNAADLKDTVLP